MTSNIIYTTFLPDQYCVYHTTYSGTLLPQNYIGSTSTDNVLNKNYHGSVESNRYKSIWLSEIKLHPELFSTVIVSYHDTRSNAMYKELQVQKILNVVKSDLFINRAYASVNGFGDTIYTPEEKATSSKKTSDTFSNKTLEEKAATSKKMSDACFNRTPEQKEAKSKKQSNAHANKTPEEKATSSKKMSDACFNRTPEQKAVTINKMLETTANRTPEEKEATAKKYSDTMANKNPEGRSRQFFSVMNSKKTYDKGNLSKYFPEFKQYY